MVFAQCIGAQMSGLRAYNSINSGPSYECVGKTRCTFNGNHEKKVNKVKIKFEVFLEHQG